MTDHHHTYRSRLISEISTLRCKLESSNLTPANRSSIYRQISKINHRLDNIDVRYKVIGNRPGPIPERMKQHYNNMKITSSINSKLTKLTNKGGNNHE